MEEALDRGPALDAFRAADPRDHLGRIHRRHGDAVPLDLGGEVRLRRPREEHAAVLDRDPGTRELPVPRPSADPVARLEHGDAAAGLAEIARGRDPREACPDHPTVGFHLRSLARPPRRLVRQCRAPLGWSGPLTASRGGEHSMPASEKTPKKAKKSNAKGPASKRSAAKKPASASAPAA